MEAIAAQKRGREKLPIIPSWIGSVSFHLFVLLLVLLYLQICPKPRQAPGVRNATVGIVLVKNAVDGKSFVDSNNNEFGEASPQSANAADSAPALQELVAQPVSNVQATEKLLTDAIGPTAATNPSVSVAGATQGLGKLGGIGGFSRDPGGKIKVEMFNVEGTGSRFVFVIDHSNSMNELGGRPMQAAKAKLVQCIDALDDLHQLNVIFYNEDYNVWRPRELPFAKDPAKESAKKFVQGITGLGGTNHRPPLVAALRLRPDVIFFLTDGEEQDSLNDGQVSDLMKLNPGIPINTIQFGVGEPGKGRNFLRSLAAQSGGQYSYVNVLELRAESVPGL